MKRGTLVMTVLVVLAMLFVSCSNGMSNNAEGEGGSSTKTVSVSLGVEFEGEGSQKVIHSDDEVTDNLTYWYMATPQWRQDKPIHGGTTDDGTNYYYVLIPNYASGVQSNLGNFTAGTWRFDVQVKKGNDVIYSGYKETALYTGNGHASVAVTVNPDTSGATGSVAISVQVPTTGAGETLQVDYTGYTGPDIILQPTSTGGNLATFETTVASLTPGAYTFTFLYKDANDDDVTEGVAQAVNVFSNQESEISGIIDAGNLIASNITINTPGFTGFSVTPSTPQAQVATVAPSTNLVFTASATSNLHNTVKYEWFVEGESQGAASTTTTFTFNRATPRGYHVTCVATDVNVTDPQNPVIVHTASIQLWVEVGYTATAAQNLEHGSIAIAGTRTIFKNGDIVPLTVTPANGYKLGQITVNGTPVGANVADYYNSVLNTRNASCYMPAAAATISATFVEDN